MICKITNFLHIFFNRKKCVNSLNFKNEKKISKIQILDLWLLVLFSCACRGSDVLFMVGCCV